MREPWFHVADLRPGDVVLDPGEARHAVQSLRLQPGHPLTLFDGEGRIASAVLLPPDDSSGAAARRKTADVRARVVSVQEVPPPPRALTLLTSACKGARLDWLVEKVTELGVTRLVLADFEHSVVRVGPQHQARLERIALEACKQCRRARRPRLERAPSPLDVAAARGDSPLLVAHPAAGAPLLGDWLAAHHDLTEVLTVVVGPEGGLSPAELESLSRAGGEPVRLGAHVLRVETAAVAVAAAWSCAVEV